LKFVPEAEEKVAHLYVIPSSFKITEGGQRQELTILTVNAGNVGMSATVAIEDPVAGCGANYGSFSPGGTVTTGADGRATIIYTAPDAISGLSECNITMTETDQSLTATLNIQFEQATGPGVDYDISIESPESLEVDQSDQITVIIHERGDQNNVIDDANVLEVNLTSLFTNMVTFGENGSADTSYSQAGTKPVYIETHTLSGSALIEVSAKIFNGETNVTIAKRFTLTVLSGPVAAVSLNYGQTLESETPGIFSNVYTLHAVDRYNNPARPGVVFHPSLINGVKVVRKDNNGTITDGSPVEFTYNAPLFGNVEAQKDILAILSPDMNQSFMGNWSIAEVPDAATLRLDENNTAGNYAGLDFIIGNTDRTFNVNGSEEIHTAHISSETGSYVTDERGTILFRVDFDAFLAGHTVTISANTYDAGRRIGVSLVTGLRWKEYVSSVAKIPNDGAEHNVTLQLGIGDGDGNVIEHLVDVDIVPSSIESNDAACDVNLSSLYNNFHTTSNGEIFFTVSTGLSSSPATECYISWTATNGGIYLDY
jgi:hypothetical protein